MENVGLYIHFPFCVRKCPYCSFYSICYNKELADEYCSKIIETIKKYPFHHKIADTVYFGGGTPVLAGSSNIKKIVDAIAQRFNIEDAEITLEANPAYTLTDKLKDFKDAGINRMSFGVQSVDDTCLKVLGRSHTAAEAVDTIKSATAIFDNVSVDLMLGVPYQTINDVKNFAKTFDGIGVEHISSYMLKIEEGTPFFCDGVEKICPQEDFVCDLYLDTVDIMQEYGFKQYEISNFAKDGFESRHNNKYWQCEDYIGLGPAAHSCIDGKRFYFNKDIHSFINMDNPYHEVHYDGNGCDLEEFVMLALRLKKGLDLKNLNTLYQDADISNYFKRAKKLEQQGLATVENNVVSLTPKGFLVSNSAILYILYGI